MAYMKFKYCNSAKEAFLKINSDDKKNLKVDFSDPSTRSDIIGDEKESESRNSGRVLYLKFSNPESVPEKEQLKKQLSKYGLVTKMFRKKEGKSYYVEFTSVESSKDFLKAYNSNLIMIEDLIEVDYAFNKSKNKDIEKISNVKLDQNETINVNDVSEIKVVPSIEIKNESLNEIKFDPNHHWQIYFDPTHNMNFYFNPFLNQSVWTLPEGSVLTPYQYQENLVTEQKVKEEEVVEEEPLEHNYYDEDAWEEDELVEKMAWDKMKEQQLKDWMKRPARQQVEDTRKDTAYIEGNYDYNIWYDKYLTDRKEEKEKIPAMHKCNPLLDTGFTKADLQEKEGAAYFCLFFAKGCCSEGVNCHYYHRVPTKEDAEKIESLRDVFGRSKFATHRKDMGGVGTFTKECRTIFVGDLKMIESGNPIKEMVRVIYENFSPWGEIEDINYIPAKATCFIRFSHRCFAEFAKEAMVGQAIVGEEILTVKWAYDDPNPMNKKHKEREHENRFLCAYKRKQENLAKNKQLYSSGYGYDSKPIRRESVEPADNFAKLTKTLKMIEDMNTENK
jgi:hypothetical protein